MQDMPPHEVMAPRPNRDMEHHHNQVGLYRDMALFCTFSAAVATP